MANASLKYAAPKTDDAFEDFCLALMKEYHELPGLERYGIRGQRQHGIDLIDLQSAPPLVAIQCKAEGLEEMYPVRDLEAEVAKALTAPFDLKLFQLLTTSKTSIKLQKAISVINENHRRSGKFLVEFKGWEQIERIADDHPEIAQDKLTIVTNAQVAQLNEGMSSLLAMVTEIRHNTNNERFDSEISTAKEEILKRELELAKSRLTKLQRDHWDRLTEDQRFLVKANLGHIEASQNLAKQGAELLFESIKYSKGTIKNREVEAQAYALSNNYEKTFELAEALRAEHPESWKATMLAIHSAPRTEKFEDLLAKATREDLTHQEVLVTLAMRAFNSGLFETGRKYAQDAVNVSDNPWPITKMTLAQCISHGVLLGNGSRPAEGFSEADKATIGEADDIFKEAIAAAIARKEPYIAAPALIERAGIAERLGNESIARGFVERAYGLDPDDPGVISAYAVLLMRIGSTDRAIGLVEGLIGDLHNGPWYKRQLAELLIGRAQKGDIERAADLLKDVSLSPDLLAPHFRYTTFAEALGVLKQVGRLGEGQALLDAAPEGLLSPVARHALTARMFWLMRDQPSAKSALEDAQRLLSDESLDIEIEIMAATFTAIEEYREALPLWRRISGIHNPLATHQSMSCARRVGEHGMVLDICREMRETGIEDEESIQIEADLIGEDDFEGAIAILKAFLAKHPDNTVIRLRISHMAILQGRADLIQLASDSIPDVETVDPYFARAVTYFLKYTRRGEEALRYGYDVLHRHFHDVNAHKAYMLLFVPIGPSIDVTFPETVAAGTAVEYLEHGTDHPRWHVIEDVLKPDLKLDEYAEDHPISKALLGKRAGDVIALSPGRVSDRPATILSITSKYIYRYHCCMNEVQLKFPDAIDLQAMHMRKLPDGQVDVSEFKAKLEGQLAEKRHLINGYLTQLLPLHFVAEVLGESTFEAILHLAGDPSLIIRSAPDARRQRLDAAIALNLAQEIVLDLSAIGTLFLCDALDIVLKLNLPIIISQGCADELDRITGKTDDGSRHAGFRLGWHQDQIIGVELSEEMQAKRYAAFAEQLDKIRAIATVEPCRDLSMMPEDAKRPLISVLGRYGAQAVLLAKKSGRILWCDDFIQSSIAVSDHGAQPVWTELIIAHLEAKRQLTRKEAVSFVVDLLNYRYHSTTITPAIFVEAARRSNYDRNASPFCHVLAPFTQIRIGDNFFAIMAGIAKEASREITDANERRLLIKTFVETLTVRRDHMQLLWVVWQAFQRVDPLWRNEWTPIIEDVITGAANTAIDFVNRRLQF